MLVGLRRHTERAIGFLDADARCVDVLTSSRIRWSGLRCVLVGAAGRGRRGVEVAFVEQEYEDKQRLELPRERN